MSRGRQSMLKTTFRANGTSAPRDAPLQRLSLYVVASLYTLDCEAMNKTDVH
jgi:hypothetical protein